MDSELTSQIFSVVFGLFLYDSLAGFLGMVAGLIRGRSGGVE